MQENDNMQIKIELLVFNGTALSTMCPL
jgi:hypothetical protein